MWDSIWPYLTAILPTIAVATIFYFLMKAILQGDHRERVAQAQWEAEQDRRSVAADTDSEVPTKEEPDNTPPIA